VTRTDLGQFHSDSYIEILTTAQKRFNKGVTQAYTLSPQKKSKKQKEQSGSDADEEAEDKIDALFGRFKLALDADKSPSAVFPCIYDYCRLYTTGTMGCAAQLCSRDANLAINWYGGMSHARKSSAHAGCYINDTVLGILTLLQQYSKVLYINLSGVHSDAVEQAFYTSSSVMTISFHSKPESDGDLDETSGDEGTKTFPGTGNVADTGVDEVRFVWLDSPRAYRCAACVVMHGKK